MKNSVYLTSFMSYGKYLVFLFALLLCFSSAHAQLAGYGFKKIITIDNTKVSGTANHTDFPILIRFTDADLKTTANGGDVINANGYDIAFTSSDGVTQLDHEIEKYVATTGEYVAWVRIPTLDYNDDTDIYMYYGNSSVTTDQSTSATWNSNYAAVWHLHNDFLDASGNSNNGTNNSTDNIAGKIADGQSSNDDFDYIQVGTNSWSAASGTIEAWAQTTGVAADGSHDYILGHTTQPPYNDRLQLYLEDQNNTLALGLGDLHFRSTNIWTFNTGQWYHVVLKWDGTNYEVFVDGTSRASGTYSGLGTIYTQADIGNTGNPAQRDESWKGAIDEVRISKIVRSDDWIQTEYNNQSSPGTFFTITSGATVNQCGPLPIELLYFRGKIQNHKVLLDWATASETDNDFFTIERSADGLNFHELMTFEGAGNTNLTLNYSAVDNNPYYGLSYYRLKQTDYDGQYSYSNTVVVKLDHGLEALDFTLFPNPTKDKLNVIVKGNAVIDLHIEIYNAQGQKLESVSPSMNIDGFELDVEHLKTGLYLVHLINEDYRGVRKFVKQ